MTLPPVVILAGGRGTRLRGAEPEVPKPLVEIGGRPIVGHVIDLHVAQGFRAFVLLTGYQHEQLETWAALTRWPDGVSVTCVDTGEDTPTGGRLHAVRDLLGDRTFLATYADGLADVDLHALLERHRAAGRTATVTVVRPRLQFGVALLDDADGVRGFAEKPRSEHWINGGFLVLEPAVFDVLSPDAVLEGEPFERLAAAGELTAYRHGGFWQCMDTYKDAAALNDLWASGSAPWGLELKSA